MDIPLPGQRWVSNTESELGLGVVLKADYARVEIFFPAAGESRQYSVKSAPLRRVRYQDGDKIKTHTGQEYTVDSVTEEKGLLNYHCGITMVPESLLADTISFSKPQERMLAGQIDDLRTYNLRTEALKWRSEIQKSPVRGFVGGRVDLLPHQLYIASEVSKRLRPRVLLADEVGLGKTIEAGMILHRLHLTGRAQRILILVPEPLVHQWFVELLRRFNLMVSIYDEERCADQESDDQGNPFLANQIILCALSFLTQANQRREQVLAAEWDMVIVDEAHHLEWTPQAESLQYQLVAALAAKSPGLLLLTATPQQLGPEGHFARLRLLDPERYDSLEKFVEEAEHYEEVASAVDNLLQGKALTKKDKEVFAKKSERMKHLSADLDQGAEETRQELVNCLLDEFGTGRVMLRNTRAALKGFPQRKAQLAPLEGGEELTAKVKWLAKLLKDLGEAKVLLICKTKKLAEQVQEQLLREINLSTALFHEGMTLIQRDRAAVHFADEEGARLLLCSEIGSEGRNFQFAHHLVLFDLPENPELLEQRIGRLDRIGQTETIHIHVPYLQGHSSEVQARWYHEGLNAFESLPHGAAEIQAQFSTELMELCAKPTAKALKTLLSKASKALATVAIKLEQGHDRLLELNSFKAAEAATIIEQMQAADEDEDFETFIIALMDRLGIIVEEQGNRSYVFRPGDLVTDALPALPLEGLFVTFDRARALSRENVGFMTMDHPLVRGAIDYLLASELGNTSFGIWKESKGEGILLDTNYIIECIAPSRLHIDRFLPMVPIRVVSTHALQDVTNNEILNSTVLLKGDASKLLNNGGLRKKFLPAMLKSCADFAKDRVQGFMEAASTAVEIQLDAELERLRDLAQRNDHVTEQDIQALEQEKANLLAALGTANHRLDSLRLIMRTQ
jgi:ATP-dependent helicase HepA